jgi:hypothetical protein
MVAMPIPQRLMVPLTVTTTLAVVPEVTKSPNIAVGLGVEPDATSKVAATPPMVTPVIVPEVPAEARPETITTT